MRRPHQGGGVPPTDRGASPAASERDPLPRERDPATEHRDADAERRGREADAALHEPFGRDALLRHVVQALHRASPADSTRRQ